MRMKDILAASRYLVLIPVILSLVASTAAFIWGAYKTFMLLHELMFSIIEGVEGPHGIIGLIAIMDIYLIATALLIFSLGMYELFIEEVDFPAWLVVHDLHDLKAKLGSVIVLVMAVAFLEHLVHWKDAWGTFLFGAAITMVSAVLIAYGHFGGKD